LKLASPHVVRSRGEKNRGFFQRRADTGRHVSLVQFVIFESASNLLPLAERDILDPLRAHQPNIVDHAVKGMAARAARFGGGRLAH
jgi:hypothetical protein